VSEEKDEVEEEAVGLKMRRGRYIVVATVGLDSISSVSDHLEEVLT
jgi:hypothetical protein